MPRQLVLIDDAGEDDFRLDDHAREVGRRGVADARQALASARVRTAA